MHSKSTTKIEINKVRISFKRKRITAYGGFSPLAAFFEKIRLKEAIGATIPLKETSPNSIGIYSKILAYTLMIYAGRSGLHTYCILDAKISYRSFLQLRGYPWHRRH
jgi:hypothetical protein